MSEATISGVFESLEENDASRAANAAKSGSLFGRVQKNEKGGSYMDFRLVDLEYDDEPSPEEGWAYIGYYSDDSL